MIEWLLSPIAPDRLHDVGVLVSWHGRLMVLAWGILVPLGILIARFFKVVPGQDWPNRLDNPAWWHAHRVCQWSAFGLSVVAVGLILAAPSLHDRSVHAVFGWIVLSLLIVQVAGGLLRGTKGGPPDNGGGPASAGDHYDMTVRRQIFEHVHKTAGYVSWMMSIVALGLGLWLANALVWMWVVLLIWWAIVILAFCVFQRQDRALDTYQAIWGPNPTLPGNRRPPIGFGVRRRQGCSKP
ncbi:MAG: cytochrome b561 domain-containing protein [Stappiaceae bacterium]